MPTGKAAKTSGDTSRINRGPYVVLLKEMRELIGIIFLCFLHFTRVLKANFLLKVLLVLGVGGLCG